MNFKNQTKKIKILTGVLTLCILFCAAFIGSYHVTAATDLSFTKTVPKKTNNLPMQDEKSNGTDTYIYDENLGVGWYMGSKDLGDDDYFKYTYTQNGYYCNSYIIEMGWNVYGDEYSDQKELVLKDGTAMKVHFADTAKDYMNDNDVVAAIEKLIDSLKNRNVSPTLEKPLILSITPVAADDIPAMVEKYFQNEDLIRFSALFPVLDQTTQKAYCRKIYNADKIALFSTIVQSLDNGSILLYVDKSEQDNKTNFFAMLSDYMQPSDLKRYAAKYYDTGNIARFSILLDLMTKDEKQEWLIKAQADKKINFVAVLSDALFD